MNPAQRDGPFRIWFVEQFVWGEWQPVDYYRTRWAAVDRRRYLEHQDEKRGLIPINGFKRRVVGYRRER